jgi:hypothetical protein
MTAPAIIEAAARALFEPDETGMYSEPKLALVRTVLAAVTPLIRAAALEEAAEVVEGMTAIPFSAEHSAYVHGQIDAFNAAACVFRSIIKEQP